MTITVDQLRTWSEQLCILPPVGFAAVLDALGIPGTAIATSPGSLIVEPPPPGASRATLLVESLGSNQGTVQSLEVVLAGPALTRSMLDGRFGTGRLLPRVDHDRQFVLAYDVEVVGAPFRCAVFAGFLEPPRASSVAVTILLRRDADEARGAPVQRLASATAVIVDAAQAAAHGLPAIGIQLDAQNRLMVTRFSQPGSYVSASGPPGGRIEFEAWNTDEAGLGHAAVRRAVEHRFMAPSLVPKVWGSDGVLEIAGARRPAVAFLSDKAFMQTGWCAALVPHGTGTLLVALASGAPGATTITCEQVVAHPSLQPILQSFQLLDR
jgi:hypothetical protein